MPQIVVEISPSGLDLGTDWRDLVGRATPNVFMHPAMTKALHAAGFDGVVTLTAWDRSTDLARLVGIWTLRRSAITPIGPASLTAPPNEYCFISNPVIDLAYIGTVMPAFLDAIAHDPALPKVVRLRYLDGGSESYAALTRALLARGARYALVRARDRAFALPDAGVKQSGSTRKKLRQDWNRLAREGSVRVINDRDPTAVVTAFETFLTIEAASWKAQRGTAVLSNQRNAGFARAMIAALAAEGNASVALLMLDGRTIAAQVLLYCGRMAYTWKTGFDVEYARHSPGAILIDRVTDGLLASGTLDAVESCSHYGSFMKRLWTGRRQTIDMVVDVNPRGSWAFYAALAMARGRLVARRWRNRARQAWNAWRKRPPGIASAKTPEV